MRRVLVDGLAEPGHHVAARVEESHHVLHVLRARPGERFRLADGLGGAAIGVFVGADPAGHALFEVAERQPAVRVPTRVVLLGAPKPALLEEAVTLGTEGGATCLLLVRARHSPPGEARLERLDRVLRAAVTQCGRPDLPELRRADRLSDALGDDVIGGVAARWLAEPGAPAEASIAPRAPAAVAIGPEGGWAPEERAALARAGFAPLGLGPFVLRTPSAVGAALARLWGPAAGDPGGA